MDTILPSEIKERLDRGENLAIVDVREDEEVAAGIIPRSYTYSASSIARSP